RATLPQTRPPPVHQPIRHCHTERQLHRKTQAKTGPPALKLFYLTHRLHMAPTHLDPGPLTPLWPDLPASEHPPAIVHHHLKPISHLSPVYLLHVKRRPRPTT